MDWEKAAAAIRGANGLDSGNMYQNYANAGVINASPAQFVGRQESIQADIDEKQRQAAAAKKKLDDQRENDRTDPSKAYMKLGEDGKYRYYNGVGDQMNINQFSLLTGKRPDELLQDSENPADQKFVQDYQTMKMFANAWVNGDNDTLKRLRASDPEKYNEMVTKYKSPAEMVSAFRNYYSDYYGNTQGANGQEKSRFTSGNFNPKFDFTPDKTDTAGKAVAKLMSDSTLDQTLSPMNRNTPEDPGAFGQGSAIGTYGPFALIGGGTLWGKTDKQKAWEDYQEKLKKDPWMAYNKYKGR